MAEEKEWKWISVRGANRYDYAQAVFDMYQKSYGAIGMHIKSANELVEKYPFWELAVIGDRPIAFSLSEKTDRGIKGTLAGTDRSPEGKAAFRDNTSERFKRPFHYTELSGRMKEIAEKLGLQALPADKAMKILEELGKHTEKIDETTYRRLLRNVGPVEKSMYGHPAEKKFPKEWHALSKRRIRFS